MVRLVRLVTTAFAVALAACGPPSDGYDVVILNGRVMDPETGFDAVTNVGIVDGIITTITNAPISGDETIDATGHVVAAGFIDPHFHGHSNPFTVKRPVASSRFTSSSAQLPQ